ncbi:MULTISPECIES: hypothetical protein [unclassified Pseudomonas]|nr:MULTISPECIES: hypothetical protein [unclassified Pseudomonas]
MKFMASHDETAVPAISFHDGELQPGKSRMAQALVFDPSTFLF